MTTTQPSSDAPTGAGPGRPGRSRPNVLAVAVDCYAGHRGDETPRRVTRGDQLVEILAVVAQWRTPDHRYFRVRMADETCTLRQDVTSGGWELSEVGQSDPRAVRAPARWVALQTPYALATVRITKNGNPIRTVDDWFQYAPPRGGHSQWRDYRSAKESARAWCPDGGEPALPAEIANVLNGHPDFQGAVIEEVTPEERVPFDDIPGEPRNSDLVAVGTASGYGFALSIEAKGDESFGALVQDELSQAARKLALEIPTRMLTRIERLADALLPRRIGGGPRLGELRYQLLTAVAGAIAYAKQRDLSRAVLIVHEFYCEETHPTKRADNQRDFERFVERISAGQWPRVADGQLLGPITVPGNEHVPGEVPLFIGKASRQLL